MKHALISLGSRTYFIFCPINETRTNTKLSERPKEKSYVGQYRNPPLPEDQNIPKSLAAQLDAIAT
jgi:hypothetical protein